MANIFPNLASGAVSIRYPLAQTVQANTEVIQFVNGSERRWRNATKLQAFTLTYTDVNSYDLSTILEFFTTMKGRFVDDSLANTFSLTLGANTWNYCVFDQDDFTEIESKIGRYSFQLKIRQVRKN